MAKKSKTQKRKEREEAEREAYENTTLLPEGAYWDEEDYLRDKDGKRLPDDLYRTKDGEIFVYEADFMNAFQS